MIKASFILACISAVAFSFDDIEVEMMAQVQAGTQLSSGAMTQDDGDWLEKKKNKIITRLMEKRGMSYDEAVTKADEIIAKKQAERQANGGGCPNKNNDDDTNETETLAQVNTKGKLQSALKNATAAPLTGGLQNHFKHSLAQTKATAHDTEGDDITPGTEVSI